MPKKNFFFEMPKCKEIRKKNSSLEVIILFSKMLNFCQIWKVERVLITCSFLHICCQVSYFGVNCKVSYEPSHGCSWCCLPTILVIRWLWTNFF
jgi:hypothetical protein